MHVVTVVAREPDLDRMLDGWQDRRTDPDGLSWVFGRLRPLAVAG